MKTNQIVSGMKSLLAVIFGIFISFSNCQVQAQSVKKNIIFVSFDQVGARSFGCYGSGINSTPFIDEIASGGTIFTRSYPITPVCAPNRASWLTGRSPVVHGVCTNNYGLTMDLPTYASVLQRTGYHTGAFGKIHQTSMFHPVPEDLKFLGFDEAVVTEDPKWGPWIDWVQETYPDYYMEALAMAWSVPSEFFGEHLDSYHLALDSILQPLIEESGWKTMYCSPLPAKVHDATFITEKSIEFIEHHLSDHSDQPFFCHISYVDPHDPYNPPLEYCDLFKPEDMPEPIPAEWTGQGYTNLDVWHTDQVYLRYDQIVNDMDQVKKMRALYHGSMKYLDDQIKELVGYLKRMDLWDNTIVMITSDHGDMMGDHGVIAKGQHPWDLGIRVPLIVIGGGVKSQVCDRLTSSLDYYPTFCEWAGAVKEDIPPVEGKPFAGVCFGDRELDGWDEVLCWFDGMYSVITDDYWRLTYYTSNGKGMMVNLKEDRDETDNLYYRPEYASKKVELFERMMNAVSRPSMVPIYRNMSVWNGKKVHDNLKRPMHHYKFLPSPAFTEDKSSLYGIDQ